MASDWRVSLVFDGHPGARKKPDYPPAICGLLRSRLGHDITVSGGKTQVFLYATTADAAEEAEHIAHEVLAQQALSAHTRLESWDSAGQAWRDARTGQPDPAGSESPAAGEVAGDLAEKAAVTVAGAIIEGLLKGF